MVMIVIFIAQRSGVGRFKDIDLVRAPYTLII
jgi:hypothetical protein